jgi:sulfoxide reductase heme-binding subunit YedZ
LGVTSTDAAVRKLGPRWNTLHQASYLIGILAIVHFALQKKLNIYEPTLMMGFLFWLLGWRLINRYWRNTGLVPMLVLAVASAILTALFEATWYGFLTGVEFMRVLEFNLMFDFVITPVWWVLGAGILVAIASLGAQWLWPRQSARTQLRPAE